MGGVGSVRIASSANVSVTIDLLPRVESDTDLIFESVSGSIMVHELSYGHTLVLNASDSGSVCVSGSVGVGDLAVYAGRRAAVFC